MNLYRPYVLSVQSLQEIQRKVDVSYSMSTKKLGALGVEKNVVFFFEKIHPSIPE